MKLVIADDELEYPDGTVMIVFTEEGSVQAIVPDFDEDAPAPKQLVAAVAVLQFINDPRNMKRLIEEMVESSPEITSKPRGSTQ